MARDTTQETGAEPLPVDAAERLAIIDSITAGYADWTDCSLSGKLSSDMLPLSPSVKIYMVKGELIVISVSAPLIGEAARIEIDRQNALVVNKLSNVYSQFSMEMVEPILPGSLEAMQNLLLGRITILGSGELSPENASQVQIYDTTPGIWTVIPNQDLENAPYVYLYAVDCADALLGRLMILAQDGSMTLDESYSWGRNDYTLTLTAATGSRQSQATLKLNYPDARTKAIDRIKLSSKYRQVSPSNLLKF